jgi:hypothetical protein
MKQTGYKFKYKNIRVKDQAFIYIYKIERLTNAYEAVLKTIAL